MRVAFDGRSLCESALRGWDRYTLALLRGFNAAGVKVSVFHRARAPIYEEHLAGISCDIVGISDKGGMSWEQIFVPRALRRGAFDIYHAPAERGVPLIAPCPVVLTLHSVAQQTYRHLVRTHQIPGVITDYLGADPSALSLASLYWRAQIFRASHLIVPSEFCRQEVIKHLFVAPQRVTATPLAASAEFFRQQKPALALAEDLRKLGAQAPYLLYVGGFERHKNAHGLLRAYSVLRPELPNLSLVMVGTKSIPADLMNEAARLNANPGSGRVTFLCNLTHELVDLYDGAALFVSLSRMETFCLPVVEARSRGILSVVGFRGAFAEVVGEAGWLANPDDPVQAAATIRSALSLRQDPQRIAAIAQWEPRFRWQKTVAATLAIYENLLQRKKPLAPIKGT